MTYDGSGKAAGLRALRRTASRSAVDVVRDTLAGLDRHRRAADASAAGALGPPFLGQIDDLRLYDRALDARADRRIWRFTTGARAILSGVTGKRTPAEAAEICASTS